MKGYRDNETVTDRDSALELSIMTVIGDRNEQQDCFGYELRQNEAIIVISDGMGGHNGGKIAGRMAVDEYIDAFLNTDECEDPIAFLERSSLNANAKISSVRDEVGKKLNGGSTVVAVIVKDGKLYWNSIGDSRGYVLRKGELVKFTVDHNYMTVLNAKRASGMIEDDEYERESEKGEALINYLGMKEISLIDYNKAPLGLRRGDKVILMTDGLYKMVPDEEMLSVINGAESGEEALKLLDRAAAEHSVERNKPRDNMTAAIIKII